MTDLEFEILDELYFVQTFDALLDSININEDELKHSLSQLIKKGWVKCMNSLTEEVLADIPEFEDRYKNYFYLATKAGLLAHNSV